MKPIAFLEDEVLLLRPLELEDADRDYPTWLNNMETSRGNSHHRFPYSRDQARNYIKKANQSESDLILAIVQKDSGQHIGNISLLDINWHSRSAKFAILIGDKKTRGIGIGYRAGTLLLNHGFRELNLHRIFCGTHSNNLAMRSLAIKLGMQSVGTLRQSVYKNNEYLNEDLFDILQTEYISRVV